MSDNEGGADDFQKGDSGAGLTYPCPCNDIKKGGHIMMKEFPCKVSEISVSKTGKHGHAKANIVGYDIFTGKKYEDIFPTSHNVDVPFIKKTEVDLIAISGDRTVTYTDENGENKDDLVLQADEEDDWVPDLIKAESEGKNILITVMQAMGKEKIVGFREVKVADKK